MEQLVKDIHHVTAIVSKSKKNIHFYTGILARRLVKHTVNLDAPSLYHILLVMKPVLR